MSEHSAEYVRLAEDLESEAETAKRFMKAPLYKGGYNDGVACGLLMAARSLRRLIDGGACPHPLDQRTWTVNGQHRQCYACGALIDGEA